MSQTKPLEGFLLWRGTRLLSKVVKWRCRTAAYNPQKGNDGGSALSSGLEALSSWLKVCGSDKQCDEHLLEDLEEAHSQAGLIARVPRGVWFYLGAQVGQAQPSPECTKPSMYGDGNALSRIVSNFLSCVKLESQGDRTYMKTSKKGPRWLPTLYCKGGRLFVSSSSWPETRIIEGDTWLPVNRSFWASTELYLAKQKLLFAKDGGHCCKCTILCGLPTRQN